MSKLSGSVEFQALARDFYKAEKMSKAGPETKRRARRALDSALARDKVGQEIQAHGMTKELLAEYERHNEDFLFNYDEFQEVMRSEKWRAARHEGRLTRVDSLRPGAEGYDIDGRRCRMVRAHASAGVYVVLHVDDGRETCYAGCAEWLLTDEFYYGG